MALIVEFERKRNPDPEWFDPSDNLGVFRGLYTAAKLFAALGIFIWIVVEVCKQF